MPDYTTNKSDYTTGTPNYPKGRMGAKDYTTDYTKDQPRVLSASTITGDKVRNAAGEDLGEIKELMIDLNRGRIAYAVLSFGGFLGMGDKLFAIPWSALSIKPDEHEFVLNVDKNVLEQAPGFDKDHWPDFANTEWATNLHSYYGSRPYWEI